MQPGANLYRLDSQSEAESNALTLIDHHPELTAATAAELSPDGNTLAVLSYTGDMAVREARGRGCLAIGAPPADCR